MATYTANYEIVEGGTGSLSFQNQVNLTLTDNDAGNNFFNVGELWTDLAMNPYGNYLGTVNFNGETFYAFDPPGLGVIYYGSVADPGTFSIDQGDLDAATVNPENVPVCFAPGTLIATPNGERVVESLEIGDLVLTADGRSVPVKWVGRQTLHKRFTPPERFVPVRVRAGALGGGAPHSDLVLTAEHALILDGLAINAGALVNGSTIVHEKVEDLPECVTYFHVETEAHEVILANGAAAETYIDYVNRQLFDNHAEYLALYGDERVIKEMPCPRISAARLLPPSIEERLVGVKVA